MEICPLVLQGAGVAAQGSLVRVCFGSGDAYGFAALILGVAFKSGELVHPCVNGLFWFSCHLCQGKRALGWDMHWVGICTCARVSTTPASAFLLRVQPLRRSL